MAPAADAGGADMEIEWGREGEERGPAEAAYLAGLASFGLAPDAAVRAREAVDGPWLRGRVRQTAHIPAEDLRRMAGARLARVKVVGRRTIEVPLDGRLLESLPLTPSADTPSTAALPPAALPPPLPAAAEFEGTEDAVAPAPSRKRPRSPSPEGAALLEAQRAYIAAKVARADPDGLGARVAALEARLGPHAHAMPLEARVARLENLEMRHAELIEAMSGRIVALEAALTAQQGTAGPRPPKANPAANSSSAPNRLAGRAGPPPPKATFAAKAMPAAAPSPAGGAAPAATPHATASPSPAPPTPPPGEPGEMALSSITLVRTDMQNAWLGDKAGLTVAFGRLKAGEANLNYKAKRFNALNGGNPNTTTIRPDQAEDYVRYVRKELPDLWPADPPPVVVDLASALARNTSRGGQHHGQTPAPHPPQPRAPVAVRPGSAEATALAVFGTAAVLPVPQPGGPSQAGPAADPPTRAGPAPTARAPSPPDPLLDTPAGRPQPRPPGSSGTATPSTDPPADLAITAKPRRASEGPPVFAPGESPRTAKPMPIAKPAARAGEAGENRPAQAGTPLGQGQGGKGGQQTQRPAVAEPSPAGGKNAGTPGSGGGGSGSAGVTPTTKLSAPKAIAKPTPPAGPPSKPESSTPNTATGSKPPTPATAAPKSSSSGQGGPASRSAAPHVNGHAAPAAAKKHRLPSTQIPKGTNTAFTALFRRCTAHLGPAPPTPLPGPLDPPDTADGIPWAWYSLGSAFQDGIGHAVLDADGKQVPGSAPRVPQDKAEAEAWYRAVIDRGWNSPAAAYSLGTLVEDRDPAEAERLYARAADAVVRYAGHPCVADFEDNGGKMGKQLLKGLARVRKRLGRKREEGGTTEDEE